MQEGFLKEANSSLLFGYKQGKWSCFNKDL